MASSDVNGLLMGVLRPALAASPTGLDAAHVGTRLPADYVTLGRFVHARATFGGNSRGYTRLTRFQVPIQIDVYALEGRDAHVLGDACIDALLRAWGVQAVMPDGHLAAVSNIVGPTEFPEPDRADGVARHLITATLTARPPAA